MKALLTGLLALLVLAGIGCKREQPKQAARATKKAAIEKKEAAVAPAKKDPQKVDPALPASVEGVPNLSLAVVEVEALLAAMKLNTRGFRRYKQKKYAQAAAAFTKALVKDPGYLTARYNLACTLALQGQGDRALVLLGQLKRAGCVLCLKQLVNAAKDKDFEGLREDERFKRLTGGVLVKEPDYREAARRVIKALLRGDSTPAIESVKAGRAVLFSSIWEDMSDGADPPEPSYNLVRTLSAANKLANPITANEVPYPFNAGKLGRCKATCCSVVQEGGQNIMDIGEVCFWPVSADKAVLISLDVTLCGS